MKLCLTMLLSFIFSFLGSGREIAFKGQETPVKHFFTHALVAHAELGFDRSNEMCFNYDNDCLTPKEFKQILTSLYEKGYALIDVKDTYEVKNGIALRRNFKFPKNKKPLVMSFDDINYYIKKMDRGMNDKLCVDAGGKFFTYTENALTKISYDNEVVTILENFVEKHPDFSYNGAKGMLCLTGFDGVLGYRTQKGSALKAEETVKARAVADALKKSGWRIACHSFGHYHMSEISDEKFISDTDKWLDQVQPVVGETEVYVYPYGDWVITNKNGKLSPKHAHLLNRGFKLFCGVGVKDYYTQLPKTGKAVKCLFMDRKPLDGISLRALRSSYLPYFDSAAVYDSRRPTPYPKAA